MPCSRLKLRTILLASPLKLRLLLCKIHQQLVTWLNLLQFRLRIRDILAQYRIQHHQIRQYIRILWFKLQCLLECRFSFR